MSSFGRARWRQDLDYADYLAEQEREAAATDARLDETTCAECGDDLKPCETDLCLGCARYIAAEAERDAEEDADMRAPRCDPLTDSHTGERYFSGRDAPRES